MLVIAVFNGEYQGSVVIYYFWPAVSAFVFLSLGIQLAYELTNG